MDSDTSSKPRRVVQAREILDKIERGEDVEYDRVIVEGDLDISGLELRTEHMDRTGFELIFGLSNVLKVVCSQIKIANSEIKGEVKLSNVHVQKPINFSRGEFTAGKADFRGAKFARANFREAKFTAGKTDFMGAEFGGDIVDFGRAEFAGDADFNGAKSWDAYFRGAKFGGLADFERTRFRHADFWNAKFRCGANFSQAKFEFAEFGESDFDDDAEFSYSDFGSAWFREESEFCFVNFNGAKFTRKAHFRKAKFDGETNFRDAKFNGETNFRRAWFKGATDFNGVKFSGDVDFDRAKFNDDATFWEAKFSQKLKLDGSKYERLYITWNSIEDNLVYSGPVYLALIKNFKIIEQFDDADDCYYIYRRKSQARKKWFSKKRFNWSKLLDWIGFVSCGYGVRIWPIIIWVLVSVFGFMFLYKLMPQSYGGIAESGPSTVTMEAMNNSTLLFTFGAGDGVISPSWGDCLYFSFTALTGGTPDGLHPVGLVKYAVMVESVLGYLFLALFVVVLARKIIR